LEILPVNSDPQAWEKSITTSRKEFLGLFGKYLGADDEIFGIVEKKDDAEAD